MELKHTHAILRDLRGLSSPLSRKLLGLIKELGATEIATLRQKALPGWRLHALRNSNMVSISLDMNYRVLAEFQGNSLLLHRVVKHDLADRASVNRNTKKKAATTQSAKGLDASNVYEVLLSLGIEIADAEYFAACKTDEDLIAAADLAPKSVANLALQLYEAGNLRIPDARFRLLQKMMTCLVYWKSLTSIGKFTCTHLSHILWNCRSLTESLSLVLLGQERASVLGTVLAISPSLTLLWDLFALTNRS